LALSHDRLDRPLGIEAFPHHFGLHQRFHENKIKLIAGKLILHYTDFCGLKNSNSLVHSIIVEMHDISTTGYKPNQANDDVSPPGNKDK